MKKRILCFSAVYPRLKVEGLIPDEVTEFFNLPNPSSRTISLGFTKPLTKMCKARLVRTADNLTVGSPLASLCLSGCRTEVTC
jgi:hypothetical protein